MAKTREVCQLRVHLQDISPQIWRRFLVPAEIRLDRLHVAIQRVMGWENYHLHQFTIANRRYGVPDPDFGDDPDLIDEKNVRLKDFLKDAPFEYLYDFGDGWSHEIRLEAIRPRDESAPCPRCLAGKLACPPEDCGGPHGYVHYLDAIEIPTHEDHDDMLAWRGPFDPNVFSVEDASAALATAFRLRKK